MSVEVILDSPLAHALNAAIPPKLIEVGWSTPGGDDSALSEYIILMLVNGKTQEQIAAELSGDLLNLGPDDPGARDFSQWLFRQVEEFNSQSSGGYHGEASGSSQVESTQDAEMGDVSDAGDGNVPTGPKSMRNGPGNRPRDKRMLSHLAKAMDRSNDSVLHRVRPQNGNERINTHARGPPTGPRQQQGPGRAGPGPRTVNSRMNPNMGGMHMQQTPTGTINSMTQQQQLALYAMLEQQSQLMAQVLGGQQQMPMGRGGPMSMGNGMANGYQHHQQPGRSLFDRVQANPQRPPNNGFRKGPQGGKFGGQQQTDATPSSSMDVEMSQEKKELDPENTTCKWNLTCTNKDCKFAHQSPAAPPGTAVDYKDSCSFGAACKNRKCTAKHPSPAQKVAFQTTTECRFGALCTNHQCPFVHPTMPLCRNGADCTTPNCKFTHTKTECKFNPCLKANCPFKHAEGQKRGKFDDKVWTADDGIKKEHVSERKFVDENRPEELIVPGGTEKALSQASTATAELVT